MTNDRLFNKDPDAVLDFAFDWTAWLSDGETISSHVIVEQTGITVDSDSESNGVVTVWLSGGTEGETYSLTCSITTSQARQDDRTIFILVEER